MDIERLAAVEGLTIRTRAMPSHLLGAWDPGTESIWVQAGLTQAARRCVIAHELEHARAGHAMPQPGYVERLVDERAARLLITPEAYARAERIVGHHTFALAAELDVIPRFIDAWRRSYARLGQETGAHKRAV